MSGDSHFETPVKTWEKNIGLNLEAVRQEFIHDGFSIGTYPGHDPREDHAADWMVPNWDTKDGKALGDELANWFWRNHTGLGLWYVIWHRRIISITPGKSEWLPYVNPVPSRRGTPSGDHLNHVHVSWHLGGTVPIFKPFPWYVVDAAKFDKTNKDPKLARVDAKTGKTEAWVSPGYKFRGEKTLNKWGRKWVETDHSNLYAFDYVTKVKP